MSEPINIDVPRFLFEMNDIRLLAKATTARQAKAHFMDSDGLLEAA